MTTITQASCADDYDPNAMPVEKARAFIGQFLQPVSETETLPLRAALGSVLASDIVSPMNVPAHRNSAMDGWAMRASDLTADVPMTLREIGASFAGKPFAGAVNPGECVRIFTGGVVPDVLDAVIMQERASKVGDHVTFQPGAKRGQNVREAGEDLEAGSVALAKGRVLRPAELGLIASLGIGEVNVARKLKVAFFSTGDELVSIGQPLAAGQLYDSNRYTLFGMLTRLGFEIIDMGVIRDDPALIETAFHQAAQQADAVITTGGVSVGEADFIRDLLAKLGEVVFWKVAMKPGRPLAYGHLKGAHFFGLPGNPVSAMATFYQIVQPALQTLQGISPLPTHPMLKAECTSAIKKAPGRMEFQRGMLYVDESGVYKVRTTGEQGSGILKSMSDANCFIVLGDAISNVAPGAIVDVQVLEGMV